MGVKLVKCDKAGHFYDEERFSQCPHCTKLSAPNDDLTVPAGLRPEEDIVTEAVSSTGRRDVGTLRDGINSVKQDPVTVGFYKSSIGVEPVVGWLVCVEGPHFGQDFRLKAGRNFIGRSPDMDIVIAQDETVSRERHAIIVYEPRKNQFIVQPGSSKELSYLNDDVVLAATEIKANDMIQAGKTKLMLIPCCSEVFHWDMVKSGPEDKR